MFLHRLHQIRRSGHLRHLHRLRGVDGAAHRKVPERGLGGRRGLLTVLLAALVRVLLLVLHEGRIVRGRDRAEIFALAWVKRFSASWFSFFFSSSSDFSSDFTLLPLLPEEELLPLLLLILPEELDVELPEPAEACRAEAELLCCLEKLPAPSMMERRPEELLLRVGQLCLQPCAKEEVCAYRGKRLDRGTLRRRSFPKSWTSTAAS